MSFLKRSSQFMVIMLTLSILLSLLSSCTNWDTGTAETTDEYELSSTWQATARPTEVARDVGKLPARDEALYLATETLSDDWMSPLCPLRGAQTPMIFIYEPLLRYDHAASNYEPGFIESFSQDGHKLQLKAKRDAFWHDRVETSLADVVYTLEWLRRLNVHPLLTTLTVNVVDDRTLTLYVDPLFDMAEALRILSQVYVVPRHIFSNLETQKTKDDGTVLRVDANMIGSGPYKLDMNDEFVVRLVLVNADPELPTYLVFPRYGDDASRLVAMENDAIDLWYGDQLSLSSVTSFMDGEAIYSVWLNSTRAPFDDPNVRESLLLTNEHDAVVTVMSDQEVWPFLSFQYLGLNESIQEFTASLEKTALTFDPEEAKRIMASSGYTQDNAGFYRLETPDHALQFVFLDTTRSKQLATALISNWKDHGFLIEGVPLAPTDYQRRVNSGEYDLLLDIGLADDRKQAVIARIERLFATIDLADNQEDVTTITTALAQWDSRVTSRRREAKETILHTLQSWNVIVPVTTAAAGYLNVQNRFASNDAIRNALGAPIMANPFGQNGLAIIKAVWQGRNSAP